MIRVALLALALLMDLDVAVPLGSPLDFVRRPVMTPTPRRKDTTTTSTPRTGKPGDTVSEDRREPSRSEPSKGRKMTPRLVPVEGMTSLDFAGHLNWPTPKPSPSNELYMHAIAFFLLELLHPDEVSTREMIEYLIEIGEPSAEAARAARMDNSVRSMCDAVIAAVGDVPKDAPPGTKLARLLTAHFPYEDGFGQGLDDAALPEIINLAQNAKHRLLRRNAVFALRLYDDESALPVLRKLLESDDKVIRNRALAGLILWRDPECVPWLINRIGDDNSFESYAVHALGRIGDARALEPILKEAQKRMNDAEFLWAAIPALGRLGAGHEPTRKFLLELSDKLKIRNRPGSDYSGQVSTKSADRADILKQRARLALARLGDANAIKWWKGLLAPGQPTMGMRQKKSDVYAPNQQLYDEIKATLKSPDPNEEAQKIARKWEAELKKYPGVKSVALDGKTLRVAVATEQDAADLRTFVGSTLDGYRVEFEVQK